MTEEVAIQEPVKIPNEFENPLDKTNADIYRLSFDMATDGLWDWEIDTENQYLSPRWKAVFGYADHEMPSTVHAWQDAMHKDDFPKAMEHYKKHLETGAPFQPILRFHTKDGGIKHILCRGWAIKDKATGKFVRMVGTHTDVSELVETRQKMEEQVKELESLNKIMMDRELKMKELKEENERLKSAA